jgi:class 3 adenylate cyclase
VNIFAVVATQAAAAIENALNRKKLEHEAVQRTALQRFVSPDVVEMIAANPHEIRLGGVSQKVTVVFADIRGFTSLSERMPPETVVELLNDYFTRVTDIIFDHGGMLDKYLGDGVMAVFGAPISKGNDAANAVCAAVEIQKLLLSLNRDAPARGWPELRVGIGINSGMAVAGNIGSLMGELIQQEHEKCELEYKVLLNQINPHFVYNVLNSIKVMADIQKIEGISEMASSLGTLLKEISKGSAEQVTLRRELELLDKYFYLQKIRKCGLLTIKYDIPDESVLDFLIPRFTLQPLAENSIYHGLDNVSRMGLITISITAQQDEVVIVIGDNGSGMSKEKIDSLLSAESMDGKEMTHVGIVNVDKRIKLFYGCGSLIIDSIVGESTTVTLRFPKILQGELTQRSVV